ncbi:DegT/DnrJ/EryC1/StrS family aminotransferase [Azospirillum canadense]|uniref:DegT/DnrJ/EryC1/StrS family aminotransferase n=1 Tax=Azospirillum canadense TaxID=403962 RepID=UPI002226D334|nr:DegT/DnrJ/EryC1/StrS family aminotransferase [Azospirillum canadense]MCW2240916.1 dTDP-4-amino-4,6-dideoxygalactose transaminase [Azospirillum canadense]
MIPLIDLLAQYRSIKDDIDQAVLNVLASAQYTLGDEVTAFENEFAAYCGAQHAIAVNSGTSALHLALLAAGAGPGTEVITVSMTFVATVAAILYTGATPVLIDVDPRTGTLDPALLEKAITPRTRAILPVHLHGQTAEMDAIRAIARAHGLLVIEDAAQAQGAEYYGARAGGLGDMACFSFYPSKNLGACGEAGAIVTSDSALADKIKMLRDWGQMGRYNHVLQGYNYRMEGIQGAVLRVKLRHLDAWNDARRQHAAFYNARLGTAGVRTPEEAPGRRHVYYVYAIRVAERDDVRDRLLKAGIATGVHYPVPVHRQPAYAEAVKVVGDLSVTEQFAAQTLSLPLYPELAREQLVRVCDALFDVCVEQPA